MLEPKPIVIGLAGGTGSGKSTVASSIYYEFEPETITIFPHDAYYKQFNHLYKPERDKLNFDHPSSLDNDLFVEHLVKLKNSQRIKRPIYDFTTHTRKPETVTVQPTKIILVDGILIFAIPAIRRLFDLKVFVDTEADLRILRRIRRDMGERGRTLDSVIEQYETTVKPMHDEFVEPSKKHADIIIPEGGYNKKAAQMLVGGIRELTNL